MTSLLAISRWIDRCNALVGRSVRWLVLIMVLVSAANATIRYTLDTSSNAWLEIQWYLFSAVFLLGSGYTLLRNEHIRIDVVSGRFSTRTQVWIDVVGTLLFLLPMAGLILWLSVPMVLDSIEVGEISGDAGGLVRWPVKILIPMGFILLILQGLSELIKKMAYLAGATEDPGLRPSSHGGDDQ